MFLFVLDLELRKLEPLPDNCELLVQQIGVLPDEFLENVQFDFLIAIVKWKLRAI